MPTRLRLPFSCAILACFPLAACALGGAGPQDDGTPPGVVTTIKPRSEVAPVRVKKHVQVATPGAVRLSIDGSGYITTHELGHASTSYVDEYVEDGLETLTQPLDTSRPHPGELALSGVVRSTKDLLAWRRDTANGIIAPRTIDLVVADADGNDAFKIRYEGALPKVTGSQAYDERFTLTYTKETWQLAGTGARRGVSFKLSSSVDGLFQVGGTAGGHACGVSIIGPEIIGPELGQIIGPERVGIIGPERSRKLVSIDGTTSKWLQAQPTGVVFPFTLSTVPVDQQVSTKVFECFLTGYSLTPLDGDTDEECTETVEIAGPYTDPDGGFLG